MNSTNIYFKKLLAILFIVTTVFFSSCTGDDTLILSDQNHIDSPVLEHRSTWETDNRFASLANEQYVQDALSFLEYVTAYFNGDTSNYIQGFTPEEMSMYLINNYLKSIHNDTLDEFPSWDEPSPADWSAALQSKFDSISTGVSV